MENNRHLLARLPELRGKPIVCWCEPPRCHGDVLASLLDRFTDQQLPRMAVTTTAEEAPT